MKKYEVIWGGTVYEQEADYLLLTDIRVVFYKDNSPMQTTDEVLATYPSHAIVRKIA